jgi:hypothetical protein
MFVCNFKQKKMARSHHRKKHREHVRQFRNTQEITRSAKTKGHASGVFAFAGAVAGLLIGYFAGSGSLIWAVAGLIIAGIAGYLIGLRIDKGTGNGE